MAPWEAEGALLERTAEQESRKRRAGGGGRLQESSDVESDPAGAPPGDMALLDTSRDAYYMHPALEKVCSAGAQS